MEGVTLHFGVEGDAITVQGDGWSPSESEFTWTVGHTTTLHVPGPKAPTPLLISLRADPFRSEEYPYQRITATVGDTVVGQTVMIEPGDFQIFLPKEIAASQEVITVTLHLPDATRPSNIDDPRVLGLMCKSLTIRPLLERGVDEADVSLTAMALSMESIGRSCEFGLAQRMAGAEPIGLLRWAATPLEVIVAALEARFEGLMEGIVISEAGVHPGAPPPHEWVIRDTRFGLYFHTWTRTTEMTYDQIVARVSRQLPFLVRELVEDLELGEKLFVYQTPKLVVPDQAMALLQAIRRYGDATLLLVMQDPVHAGEVITHAPGMLVGFLSELTDENAAHSLRWPEWRALIPKAYRAWKGAA